jgi:hypothetical protein
MRRRWHWLAAALTATLAVVLAKAPWTAPRTARPAAAPRSPTIAPVRPPPATVPPATRTTAGATGSEPTAPRIERTAALADGTRLTVRARRATAALDEAVELELQLDDGSGRPVVSEGERLSVLATQGDRAWRGGVFEDADRAGRYWTRLALPDAEPGALEIGVALQPAGRAGTQGGVSLMLSLEP